MLAIAVSGETVRMQLPTETGAYEVCSAPGIEVEGPIAAGQRITDLLDYEELPEPQCGCPLLVIRIGDALGG